MRRSCPRTIQKYETEGEGCPCQGCKEAGSRRIEIQDNELPYKRQKRDQQHGSHLYDALLIVKDNQE